MSSPPSDRRAHWIERNRLIELLQEIPADAALRISENKHLIFVTEKQTGYIDLDEELVELVPDHP